MIIANSKPSFSRRHSMNDMLGTACRQQPSEQDKEDSWKRQIRQQIDDELNRRVRDALETPPLERLRRRQQQRLTSSSPDLNAHLDLTEKEQEYLSRRRHKQQTFIPSTSTGLTSSEAAFNRYLAERSKTSDPQELQGYVYRGAGVIQSQTQRPQHVQNMVNLVCLGVYSDEWQLTEAPRQRPTYPYGSAPIIPHPKFKNIINPNVEPLYTSIPVAAEKACVNSVLPSIHRNQLNRRVKIDTKARKRKKSKVPGATTFDNQVHSFTHKWRGICITYDSEKSPREQQLEIPKNPLIAPNLIFESRFESGNLRQARRVGQFEYELVLKTDVFTKRHTQWFYFRVQNMVAGVIYKFRIVNLLKKDSLYNHGMRPLIYSDRSADEKNIGWYRHGHHISYGRNVQHVLCPLLSREIPYYELEFQMEFPFSNDTCYLAHCYPYTYTDLKNDLDSLLADPIRSQYIKKEVLCESKAGNSCYLLTITDFDAKKKKQNVVVSARVHPGESNASWMMKGLLDHITSESAEAQEMRRRFVYKIVPMLNPDGVIVGNYRCSLQAKDLNRNYRHPRRDNFPTVFHMKKLVEDLYNTNGVFVYCDFHGHSRKANVFMYGNNTSAGNVKSFLDDRMLPYCISKAGSHLFSFESCKFHIRKCKESTGRVVMFRAFNIKNSFTMESTFSGTVLDKNGSRHFNQRDFMDAGVIFSQGVLRYSKLIEDKLAQNAIVVDMTKEITRQLIEASQLDLNQINDSVVSAINQQLSGSSVGAKSGTPASTSAPAEDNSQLNSPDKEKANRCAAVLSILNNITEDSMMKCINLLEKLSVPEIDEIESESSDSDSESESEVIDEKETKKKKKKSKKRKDKKQLPLIPGAINVSKGSGGRPEFRKPNWTNPYEGRSNGGIPCYSEERSMERAAKRMAELQRRMDEKLSMKNSDGFLSEQEISDLNSDMFYQELNELQSQKQQLEDHIQKTIKQQQGKRDGSQNHIEFIQPRPDSSEDKLASGPSGGFRVKRSRTEIQDSKKLHARWHMDKLATDRFDIWNELSNDPRRRESSTEDKTCSAVEFRLPPPGKKCLSPDNSQSMSSIMFSREYTEMLASRIRASHHNTQYILPRNQLKSTRTNPLHQNSNME